jgi:hypothetical protein
MATIENDILQDVNLQDVDLGSRSAPPVSELSSGSCSRWTDFVHRIHQPILKVLLFITSIVATNPKRTVVAVIVLSVLLFVVGLFTNFNVNVDVGSVWTPKGARSSHHKNWIEDESGFPAVSRYFNILFHCQGENVLGEDNAKHVFQALDAVRGLEDYDAVCSASKYLDKQGNPACRISGVTAFWNNTAAIFEKQIPSGDDDTFILAMSAEMYPDGTAVAEKLVMGFPERFSNSTLSSAQSYFLVVELPDNDDSKHFEEKALDVIIDLDDAWQAESTTTLRVEVAARRSFEEE